MHIGIDVGEKRLFGAALGGGQLQLCPSTTPAAVLDWAADFLPVTVAIDSPPAVSLSLAKKGARRICEELLGISGCYATPPQGHPLPAWMATGMDAHRRLGKRLNEPLDLSGAGRIFEVHPTYGFRSILGVLDRPAQSPRIVCDPQRLLQSKSPRGSVGHIQRVEILAIILGLFGVLMSSALRKELLKSLDVTDSALCAVLGALRSRSQCRMVGDPREGTIVITDPTKLATVHGRCVRAILAAATPAPPPPARMRMTRGTGFEAAMLRAASNVSSTKLGSGLRVSCKTRRQPLSEVRGKG